MGGASGEAPIFLQRGANREEPHKRNLLAGASALSVANRGEPHRRNLLAGASAFAELSSLVGPSLAWPLQRHLSMRSIKRNKGMHDA